MDPVEAEEQQTEPPDDEAYAEADPTGRFIRVRTPCPRRVLPFLLAW